MKLYENDTELILGCLANERRAWNTFVQSYTRYVYFMINATAKRYQALLGEEEIADLHADIFTSFIENDYKRLRDFEGRNQCSLRSWVRMISVRRTIDHLRKGKHAVVSIDALRSDSAFEPESREPDALTHLLDRESIEGTPDLNSLMSELSSKDRLLLELFLVQKLKAPEVAKVLHTSVGAVYTRKNRLIERLQASVKKNRQNV